MNTSKNNMDPQAGDGEPVDPVLDGLLNEAFSAKHVASPKGMNDRILAAMAQAHKAPGVDSDGNEGHVVASIGVVRWVWVGIAAAALFAVSAVLLLQSGGPVAGNGQVAVESGAGGQSGSGQNVVAILEMEMSRFSDLGSSEKDPLDRDLAALDSKIDQMNKMWMTDPLQKTGAGEF